MFDGLTAFMHKTVSSTLKRAWIERGGIITDNIEDPGDPIWITGRISESELRAARAQGKLFISDIWISTSIHAEKVLPLSRFIVLEEAAKKKINNWKNFLNLQYVSVGQLDLISVDAQTQTDDYVSDSRELMKSVPSESIQIQTACAENIADEQEVKKMKKINGVQTVEQEEVHPLDRNMEVQNDQMELYNESTVSNQAQNNQISQVDLTQDKMQSHNFFSDAKDIQVEVLMGLVHEASQPEFKTDLNNPEMDIYLEKIMDNSSKQFKHNQLNLEEKYTRDDKVQIISVDYLQEAIVRIQPDDIVIDEEENVNSSVLEHSVQVNAVSNENLLKDSKVQGFTGENSGIVRKLQKRVIIENEFDVLRCSSETPITEARQIVVNKNVVDRDIVEAMGSFNNIEDSIKVNNDGVKVLDLQDTSDIFIQNELDISAKKSDDVLDFKENPYNPCSNVAEPSKMKLEEANEVLEVDVDNVNEDKMNDFTTDVNMNLDVQEKKSLENNENGKIIEESGDEQVFDSSVNAQIQGLTTNVMENIDDQSIEERVKVEELFSTEKGDEEVQNDEPIIIEVDESDDDENDRINMSVVNADALECDSTAISKEFESEVDKSIQNVFTSVLSTIRDNFTSILSKKFVSQHVANESEAILKEVDVETERFREESRELLDDDDFDYEECENENNSSAVELTEPEIEMAAFSETQTSLDNFDVSMKETGPQLVPSNTPNDILAKSKIRDSMPRLFGSPVNDKPTNVSELAITDIQQNSVKSQVNTPNGDEFLTPEYEDACMEAVQVSKEIVPETFFGHVVHTRDNMKFITHIPDICLVRVNTNGSWTKNFSSVESILKNFPANTRENANVNSEMIQSSENISPCNINYPNKRTVETIPSVRKVRKIGYREGELSVDDLLPVDLELFEDFTINANGFSVTKLN